jgi:hypothetical protein
MDLRSKEPRLIGIGWGRLAPVVLFGLAALPLSASPIHLRCLIQDQYLLADYDGEIPKVQKELCQELKQRLKRRELLLAWDYVVDDDPRAATRPALVLTLSNDGQRRKVTLQLERQSIPVNTWGHIWKDPGDPVAVPLAAGAAKFFASKADDLILAVLEETIGKNLLFIPLAIAKWSPTGPPKVVTSLPWKGNEALSASRFRLACQMPDQSAVDFESHALRPENGTFSLEALSRIQDSKRVRDILPEAKRATPRWLHLLQFHIPDDTETF